ncbi:hypothetical protein FFLO_04150 [Filobasidium floriforme]|uniref:Uncharacterized protein n=1 Tax=Filobasidium floriforme TaxID=5210 RepID=A0A8K0NPI9_9TREE|nr:uncharacterized protein HD553DRAFT_341478 [Filobasidium floriforme]KAG7531708.1 hypothetical protein FFLO_04150 [Filobasidium floriforme]KAH8085691.1 hypothetical protein HD553DRAFT_341478 [Filobasidium floriforme]
MPPPSLPTSSGRPLSSSSTSARPAPGGQKRNSTGFASPITHQPKRLKSGQDRAGTPISAIDPTLMNQTSAPSSIPRNVKPTLKATSSAGGNSKTQWKSLTTDDGSQSAEDIVVEWLMEGENYDRYKHLQKSAKTGCCEQILGRIKEAGISCDKTPSMVESKIRGITEAWREADTEWFSTGNGVTQQDVDEDEAEMTEDEREVNQRKRRDRAAFIAKFEKRFPYYERLAPILGSRNINRPTTLLETGREDSVPVETQLGLNVQPDENSIGALGEPEDDPNYAYIFSAEAENDYETDDETNASNMLSLTKKNQLSPTGSASSKSTSRSTKSASRDPALISQAGKKARKENVPTDDFITPITRMIEASTAMDSKMLEADREYKMRTASLEERRVALAEKEYDDKMAERSAKRRQEELDHESKLRMAEAEQAMKLKAEQARQDRELMAQRLSAFERYCALGLGPAEAKEAAGL